MALKRSEFRELVWDRADDPNGQVASKSVVNTWLNLAIRAIWKAWPWSFATKTSTITTSADDNLYDLPADCQHPTKLVNTTTAWNLRPHSCRVLLNAYPDETATGEPRYYCDGGLKQESLAVTPVRQVRLFPTPDATYSIKLYYKATAPSMTDDEHYSPLPEEFEEATVLWCLMQFYRKVEDLALADAFLAAFMDELNSLIGQFGNSWQMETYPVIFDEGYDIGGH